MERTAVERSLRRAWLLAVAALAVLVVAGCGNGEEGGDTATIEHIHGLGIDPGDGALLIATHEGLFRAPDGERRPSRVGDSRQDLMGFTVVGPRRYLASGHPAPDQPELPPLIGLIESRDGGESWEQVSLAGEADFHILRAAGERIYGFNSADGALMASDDGGRGWQRRSPPGPLLDLAVDPRDPRRLVAAGEQGLSVSTDAGARWKPLARAAPGLLAWGGPRLLYRIDAQGAVGRSEDGGRRWREGIGSIGAQPVAFAASGAVLYAGLPDGTVKSSADAGASWSVRAAP